MRPILPSAILSLSWAKSKEHMSGVKNPLDFRGDFIFKKNFYYFRKSFLKNILKNSQIIKTLNIDNHIIIIIIIFIFSKKLLWNQFSKQQ